MSQEEFAAQINASANYVRRLEDGLEEPRILALIACANVFGISVTELLELARLERASALVCIETES
jgi:transcriptional regulator with XRE-family HTH domain